MNRAGRLVLVVAPCALAACQLVAGIQDRVLVSGDGSSLGAKPALDATTGDSDDRGDSPSASDDGPLLVDPSPDGASFMDASTGASADVSTPSDASSGPVDAPVDGSGSGLDSSSVVDASSGDAFAGTPCSSQTSYIFCDDFDSITQASTGWTWTNFGVDAGSVALGHNAPATPPNCLAVVVPPILGSNSMGEGLGTVGQFTLAFDLRIDTNSLDDIPYAIVAQVVVDQGDAGAASFNYSLGTGASRAVQLYTAAGTQTFISLPVPPLHQWMHVTLAYSTAAGFSTTQDGVSMAIDSNFSIVPGTATLIVAEVYATPGSPAQTGTLSYSMDDIVIQGSAQ